MQFRTLFAIACVTSAVIAIPVSKDDTMPEYADALRRRAPFAKHATPKAPIPKPETGTVDRAAVITYKHYVGDGTVAQGWPAQSHWLKVEDLWARNLPDIQKCAQSASETDSILKAITSVSASTGVPASFILATIVQESSGCVRVPNTNFGVENPGLMQSHNGRGTCVGVNPCPADQIHQMIADGTDSTPASEGVNIKDLMAKANGNAYAAARMYNSGPNSIPPDGDLSGPELAATPAYSSDIANRLLGYTGPSNGRTA